MRKRRIQQYAEAMRRDEWRLTSEPIAFCAPGVDPDTHKPHGERLIDGQHRLEAVLKSKATVQFTVWFGCDPDELKVIGHAAERSNGDVLAVSRPSLQNPVAIASIVSAFIRNGLSHNMAIEPWMVRRVLKRIEPDIVAVIGYKQTIRGLGRRELIAALVLAHLVNPEKTASAVKSIKDGLGFTLRDPMRTLREYLIEYTMGVRRDTPDAYFYNACSAMAHKLSGEEIQRLRLNPAGLRWLRENAKAKINPILHDLFGRIPINFYNPQLSAHTLARANEEK